MYICTNGARAMSVKIAVWLRDCFLGQAPVSKALPTYLKTVVNTTVRLFLFYTEIRWVFHVKLLTRLMTLIFGKVSAYICCCKLKELNLYINERVV